jgi:hypothetical protein
MSSCSKVKSLLRITLFDPRFWKNLVGTTTSAVVFLAVSCRCSVRGGLLYLTKPLDLGIMTGSDVRK